MLECVVIVPGPESLRVLSTLHATWLGSAPGRHHQRRKGPSRGYMRHVHELLLN